MCAGNYTGPFYDPIGAELGVYNDSIARISDPTILQEVHFHYPFSCVPKEKEYPVLVTRIPKSSVILL